MAKPLVPKTIFSFSVSQHANERQSFFTSAGKKSPHCGDLRGSAGSSAPAFHLQTFFASGKALLCRYLLQTPLFSFAQNRGKFAPNCLALQLLHLFRKAAHKGKQGAKKGEPFWLAFSCVFLFYFSYLVKSSLADICSKHLLFSFTQNRGKFAPNCLALPLAPPAPQNGTQGQTVCKKSEPLWLASLRCFLFCELLCSFDENYSQSDRIFSRNFVLCACMITLHIKSKSLKSCLHFPFRKSKTIIFSVCYLITFIPICSAQFR